MSELVKSEDYRQWIVSIKKRIQASQIKAAVAVNRELLELYWFIGEQIVEKQKNANWGDGLLKQMSSDLDAEFPDIRGFSKRNLELIRQWFSFWMQTPQIPLPVGAPIAKQLVSQIPWGHNILIVQKLDDPADALFYVQKTVENNWSRAVLTHQIESKLHLRTGRAINNFAATLPEPESDLARQLLRDPYNFDFLTLNLEIPIQD